MKYRIVYYFDGTGTAIVEAKSKKEAEAKYDEGDCTYGEESGDNYCIDYIEKV